MKHDKSRILEFKRMIRQYEYSLEDLDDIKEIQSEINSEFGSAIAALKRPDLFDNSDVEKIATEFEEEEPIDNERDPNFKKLFRKVVVKSHPDKLGNDISPIDKIKKQDLYEKAVKANDEYNWALLITVAIKLEIELGEEYHEYVGELSNESEKVQKEIETIQNSVAWQWYYADPEKKDEMLRTYVKHMESVLMKKRAKNVKIVGLGHPRTGTGFTSAILNSWGLDVGHEILGKDGIVAWQLAVELGPWPYMPKHEHVNGEFVIYNVRDPKTSIPSIVFTENTKSQSLIWRIETGGVPPSNNRVEQAIHSILRWDRLITLRRPNFTYRIEDQSKDLYNFLKSNGMEIEWVEPIGAVNVRLHQSWEELEEEKQKVRPSLKLKMNSFCKKYGYDPLFT